MKSLRAGISFFSTIRAGGEFEDLTRNLYVMPAIGAILGAIVGIAGYPLSLYGLGFLIVVVYLGVEGINHVDGLSDFFDAYFAPESRKLKALKDLNTGTGGTVAVALYIILLTLFFTRIDPARVVPALVLSQSLAKQGMLHLMLSSRPLWEGMVSEFVRHARRRDYASYAITLTITLLIGMEFLQQTALSLAAYLLTLLAMKVYADRRFGGINGDVVGATNCLIFLAVIGVWACSP
ncbi:adenosylcobinamide-GDP ribazoletransferase [Geoglobus ahangari]